MPRHASAEILQRLILEYELPRREQGLFGVMCPYCGKSDRIRLLESPEELDGDLRGTDRVVYSEAWHDLTDRVSSLGICRFCTNVLKLSEGNQNAFPFDS